MKKLVLSLLIVLLFLANLAHTNEDRQFHGVIVKSNNHQFCLACDDVNTYCLELSELQWKSIAERYIESESQRDLVVDIKGNILNQIESNILFLRVTSIEFINPIKPKNTGLFSLSLTIDSYLDVDSSYVFVGTDGDVEYRLDFQNKEQFEKFIQEYLKIGLKNPRAEFTGKYTYKFGSTRPFFFVSTYKIKAA